MTQNNSTADHNAGSHSPAGGNRPADTLRDRGMKATIWRNQGEQRPFYTAEFVRSFRDASGDWHDSHSFGADGLLKLSLLAQQTYSRIRELEMADREQAGQSRPDAGGPR